MNTWGVGSFENDSARDFVREALQDGVPALQEAFEVALDPDLDYLEAEEGCRALAAAEIVVAGLTGNTQQITDAALRAWIALGAPDQLAALRNLAAEAVARVLASESELPDTWAESADANAWQKSAQRLKNQLGA